MDAERVDQLSRSVAAMTRRRGLRLLSAGVLGTLLVRLGVSPVGASHGCRHIGKACARSSQCCSGARCKHGACKCKSTHFKCGSDCCPDGATCLTLPLPGEPKLCQLGDKGPGAVCDPAQPGACASGICTPQESGGLSFCREADCEALRGPCSGNYTECCEGRCIDASVFCGDGPRCCQSVDGPCQEDCDCCFFPDFICRKGTCCLPAFAQCTSSPECCGSLVCGTGICVKP